MQKNKMKPFEVTMVTVVVPDRIALQASEETNTNHDKICNPEWVFNVMEHFPTIMSIFSRV